MGEPTNIEEALESTELVNIIGDSYFSFHVIPLNLVYEGTKSKVKQMIKDL